MFDSPTKGIGLSEAFLPSGESHDDLVDDLAEDEIAFRVACLEMADDWSEPDRHFLPDDLESMPAGLALAAVVSSVDRSKLNGHDAVRLMQAEDRVASSYGAARLATMVEVAYCPPGHADSPVERSPDEIEYASVEIAAALTLTRRAAESELNTALRLRGRLGRVWDRYSRGTLSFRKVRQYVRELGHLDTGTVDEVLDQTLDQAAALTTGQLRSRISRSVMRADPEGSESSFHEGLAERRVGIYPNPDFTGSLTIQSSDPAEIQRARSHIETLARMLKVEGEPRGIDQLRADVALDLLQGKCHCGSVPPSSGNTHLIVDLGTLAELSNAPGELAGYGPVIAEIARNVAHAQVEGQWTYAVTDNGRVLATGTLTRRPTSQQLRHIGAVYGTCTFVGCRMPAHDCDLDHRRPHAQGGPTHNDNLGPLCRHHHMARHHVPWLLEHLPTGDHRWTSPLGHDYVKERGPPD